MAVPTSAGGTATVDTFSADIAKVLSSTPYSFKTVSVSVSFGGTPDYDAYKKLLKTIEQSALILDLYQINYSNQGSGTQQIGTLEKQQTQVNYSFELKSYYLESNETTTE